MPPAPPPMPPAPAPVTAAPAPMAATPAPMAATPAPVAAMPPYLVRRKTVDIVLRGDRGFGPLSGPRSKPLPLRGNRRQRRRLGFDDTCGERGRARDKSKGELQKVAAFHHIPPLQIESD